MTKQLKYFGIIVLIAVVSFSFLSCTPKQMASDLTSKIMMSGAPSFEMEADVEVAQDAAMSLLKIIEVFQYDNSKNKNFNTLLARSYANYTMGFLEFDLLRYKGYDDAKYDKALKKTKLFYKRGKDYGLNALKRSGSFKKALTKDLDSFKKVLKGMGRSYVPRLFWTALNWGSLINLSKDSPLAIAQYPKVEAMMERVVQLDPSYFYAVPQIFFGVSYGSRPKMFGGNLPKAQEYFEKALNAYNRQFLMAQVFYAQFYAAPSGDKVLFENLLNEVVNADAGALPQARLANELAKIKAEWMLEHKKDFFQK